MKKRIKGKPVLAAEKKNLQKNVSSAQQNPQCVLRLFLSDLYLERGRRSKGDKSAEMQQIKLCQVST